MFRSVVNGILSLSIAQFVRADLFIKSGMHSDPISHTYNALKVMVIPALQDNYMYLVIDSITNEAAVVDPVDPDAVINATTEENVTLTTILTTHHHWDHAGGNIDLVKKIKDRKLTVVGGDDDRIPGVTKRVKHGDEFRIGTSKVKCLSTPCHTTSHICYHVTTDKEDASVVFTGDTLFVGGCGRFFEGTAEMMNEALNVKLASLPDDTKVFCGHEYTLANLKFALTVEPNNKDMLDKYKAVEGMRLARESTIPSTIGEEKKTNPFMRVHLETVRRSLEDDAITTMKNIRKLKDNFKG